MAHGGYYWVLDSYLVIQSSTLAMCSVCKNQENGGTSERAQAY